MRRFGLIGYPLTHSFSKKYFAEKFEEAGLNDCAYDNYPLEEITRLPSLLEKVEGLEGLNVTIPYKEKVIAYLDRLSGAAAELRAVNCIRIGKGEKVGFNTDVFGFKNSLLPLLKDKREQALILGTGGASKAVAYVLRELNIAYHFVSRRPLSDGFTYGELNKEILSTHKLIVNTTPLGTFPKTDLAPEIPYSHLTEGHILHDLVYNPSETLFMKKGRERGASVKNGYDMLVGQAEASWDIWNAVE